MPMRKGGIVEKNSYDAASLARTLRAFEEGYGLPSADFYRAHIANDESVIGTMSGSHRQAWAGFYCEWRRMSGSSFSARVERDLELA
jgi:hypothetical protein